MAEVWTPLVALHAVGATAAVGLGAYLVSRRRKGDLLHRRIGRVWMADMYWVAFSSFGIKRLSPGHFTWIHGLSAWTIFSLTMAVWAARTHRIQLHRGWVIGTYCGLIGAGIAAVAFPTRLVPQTAGHHPLWLLGGVLTATALAAAAIEIAALLPARRHRQPLSAVATTTSAALSHPLTYDTFSATSPSTTPMTRTRT